MCVLGKLNFKISRGSIPGPHIVLDREIHFKDFRHQVCSSLKCTLPPNKLTAHEQAPEQSLQYLCVRQKLLGGEEKL